MTSPVSPPASEFPVGTQVTVRGEKGVVIAPYSPYSVVVNSSLTGNCCCPTSILDRAPEDQGYVAKPDREEAGDDSSAARRARRKLRSAGGRPPAPDLPLAAAPAALTGAPCTGRRPDVTAPGAAPPLAGAPRNASVWEKRADGVLSDLRSGLYWPDGAPPGPRLFPTLRMAKDLTRAAVSSPPA